MFIECYDPSTAAYVEYVQGVTPYSWCTEVPFQESVYYLSELYSFCEVDPSFTRVGDTVLDNMDEGDAARLRLAQDFESGVLVPLFSLSYDGLIADGVPSHSYSVDYGLVDAAGLFVGLDAAIASGLLPIDGPTYDDLAAYLTGQIADYDAAGLIRPGVVEIVSDIIADAKVAAAAS